MPGAMREKEKSDIATNENISKDYINPDYLWEEKQWRVGKGKSIPSTGRKAQRWVGHGRDQPGEQGGGVPEELWGLRHTARLHQIMAGTKDRRGVAVFKKDETTDSVGRKVA